MNKSGDWPGNYSFFLNPFQIHVIETNLSGILSLIFYDIFGGCMLTNIRVNL